ncbi:hypothetical protein BGZ95_009311 [Linnemannia exigua]|uniref:WD40 repeat-like protein n=1 Tax=Linnemannia exigua TaxID=604196 RepID=A0AAD4DD01_9FUNG|nr:hypothetical protein BGZ95_009311 [Linnemannia exigua]
MLQQYDADTGKLGLALRSHINFKCAAYSPNGSQIATASMEGEVRLWNAQSCVVEHVIQTKEPVSILAYSPCGRWIALRLETGGVKVWDARSESSQHICLDRPPVNSLAFSPNGLNLAVGYRNGDIRVWETSTWICKMVIKGIINLVACVVYPPKSSYLACYYVAGAKGIRLFDEKGEPFQTILEHEKIKSEKFTYSSCGQWIAAADGQKVDLWTYTSNGIKTGWAHATTVKGFFGNVEKVTWRPNATEFATASQDGSIRAWKVEKESGNVSVQLLWGYGGTVLTTLGAVLVGSVGLTNTNQKLLQQRGAIFESSSSANNSA